jgi:predicted kinase
MILVRLREVKWLTVLCFIFLINKAFAGDFPFTRDENRPILYVPIGPSGAGKSTLGEEIVSECPGTQIFSLDALRLSWYPFQGDYNKSWEASAKDPTFTFKAQELFKNMVSSAVDIYCDMTNLTPEKRKFYVQTAKEGGYSVIGIVFSRISLEELNERQKNRPGKTIDPKVVEEHCKALTLPKPEEAFDQVFFVDEGRLIAG